MAEGLTELTELTAADADDRSVSSWIPRAVVPVLFGFSLVLVLVVVVFRRWSDSAYDDIPTASNAYEPPASWELTSFGFTGSKRFRFWTSDTRQAVLVYVTDESGAKACEHAVESLKALSGKSPSDAGRTDVGFYSVHFAENAVRSVTVGGDNFWDFRVHNTGSQESEVQGSDTSPGGSWFRCSFAR